MSVDVLREVFRASQSKGVARNVLTVLADAAHPDGVTWLPIAPSKKRGADPSKCITHRANASRRAVIDALQSLEDSGEIEVRQAQRGRQRINVYRVVLGSVGWLPVDYSDMPFELDRPFNDDGVQNLHLVGSGDGLQSERDGVQSPPRQGAVFVSAGDAVPQVFADAEASFAAPKPEGEPSEDPAEQGRSSVAALVEKSLGSGSPRVDVEPLLELLPAHEIAPNTRTVFERKFGYLPPHFVGLAREELLAADDVRSRVRYLNGIVDRMIDDVGRRETPEQARERWTVEHAGDPDAHAVVDGWDGVDPFERQQLHELVERGGHTTTRTEAAA